jgi:hypothetical protein
MEVMLEERSYDQAVAKGLLVVNVDKPTSVVRLHRAPGKCAGLRDGFVRKVVVNRRKTGSYWAVQNELDARERWGDRLSVCKRCG